MATIGLLGSYGGLNIGDEAILTSILATLREAVPFAEVVVFSRDAAHTRDAHLVDRVIDARRGRCDAVNKEIAGLDVLVLGGGGLLYDSEATEYLRHMRTAHRSDCGGRPGPASRGHPLLQLGAPGGGRRELDTGHPGLRHRRLRPHPRRGGQPPADVPDRGLPPGLRAGFADSYVAQSGVQVGVRETRRVLGHYVLTGEDILSARKFDDVIARGTYPVDIHNPNGRGTVLRSVPPGDAYDVPLRCLVPRDVDDLLTAGRCISGTHEAHSSYRVTPTAMATGQAAGVCAALAAAADRAPRDVEIAAVQAELIRQGADLGARVGDGVVARGQGAVQ